MKLRITEHGWAGFTGHLGSIEFIDGVSVEDVSRADASYLAAIVAIEDADTGKNPSDAQAIIDAGTISAPMEKALESPAPQEPKLDYTKESLEAIADASGIKGIREVADTFGLKGNSIVDLIDKILSTQLEKLEAAKAAADAAK